MDERQAEQIGKFRELSESLEGERTMRAMGDSVRMIWPALGESAYQIEITNDDSFKRTFTRVVVEWDPDSDDLTKDVTVKMEWVNDWGDVTWSGNATYQLSFDDLRYSDIVRWRMSIAS